jgi:quercetin dioxygenase-like cupin family protein
LQEVHVHAERRQLLFEERTSRRPICEAAPQVQRCDAQIDLVPPPRPGETVERRGALAYDGMKRWDLTTLPPSTEKEQPRAPGAGAPRVPREDGRIPRVLFSSPECRAVVIELAGGESMGEHHVRERAVVQVVSGRVAIDAGGEQAECGAGTLVTFAPGEQHALRALDDAKILLVLSPWPGAQHYSDGEPPTEGHVPANASVDPI